MARAVSTATVSRVLSEPGKVRQKTHDLVMEAVRRSVLQWRFIDGIAARIDDAALREAQMAKDAIRAYELVYAAMGGE